MKRTLIALLCLAVISSTGIARASDDPPVAPNAVVAPAVDLVAASRKYTPLELANLDKAELIEIILKLQKTTSITEAAIDETSPPTMKDATKTKKTTTWAYVGGALALGLVVGLAHGAMTHNSTSSAIDTSSLTRTAASRQIATTTTPVQVCNPALTICGPGNITLATCTALTVAQGTVTTLMPYAVAGSSKSGQTSGSEALTIGTSVAGLGFALAQVFVGCNGSTSGTPTVTTNGSATGTMSLAHFSF